tara:strand:- start:588 stop:866 length:279 start_codon:yes stop_codon:yes gene_type:complete
MCVYNKEIQTKAYCCCVFLVVLSSKRRRIFFLKKKERPPQFRVLDSLSLSLPPLCTVYCIYPEREEEEKISHTTKKLYPHKKEIYYSTHIIT